MVHVLQVTTNPCFIVDSDSASESETDSQESSFEFLPPPKPLSQQKKWSSFSSFATVASECDTINNRIEQLLDEDYLNATASLLHKEMHLLSSEDKEDYNVQ